MKSIYNFLYFKAKTMTLKFKSNKSVNKPGFKATVTGNNDRTRNDATL